MTGQPSPHTFMSPAFRLTAAATFVSLTVVAIALWFGLRDGPYGTLTHDQWRMWTQWLALSGGGTLVVAAGAHKNRALSAGVFVGLICSAAAVFMFVVADMVAAGS